MLLSLCLLLDPFVNWLVVEVELTPKDNGRRGAEANRRTRQAVLLGRSSVLLVTLYQLADGDFASPKLADRQN